MRAVWSRSKNHIDPLGAYTDSYNTNRSLPPRNPVGKGEADERLDDLVASVADEDVDFAVLGYHSRHALSTWASSVTIMATAKASPWTGNSVMAKAWPTPPRRRSSAPCPVSGAVRSTALAVNWGCQSASLGRSTRMSSRPTR